MLNLTTKIVKTPITGAVYLLYFLTPLTFVFATKELFEFPKMTLVYFFSLAILGLTFLSLRSGFSRKIPFAKPLFLLVVVNLISTIFSLNIYTSIFGYYSRFNGGSLSLIAFAAIFVCLSFILNRKLVDLTLTAILTSGALISLYALLQNFGFDKDLWVQDSQARAFSTLGQPNWLAAYLLVIFPIPLYFFLKENGGFRKWFFFTLTVLFYFAFWSTYSLSGFLGLLAFVFFFAFGSRRLLKAKWKELILLAFICLAVSLARPGIFGAKLKSFLEIVKPAVSLSHEVLAASSSATTKPQSPKSIDTGDIRLGVWQGALKLWVSSPKNFLVGTGPETFAYAFLPFRPDSLNKTTEWDFLYNKAHNYYLDILCGVGILGFIAFFIFSIGVTKKIIKNANQETLSLPGLMLYGWVTIFVTNFFGWPTVALSLLFFTYPIIMMKLTKAEEKENEAEAEKNISLGRVLLVLIISAPMAVGILNIFLADVSYSRGYSFSQRDETLAAESNLKDAVSLNPREPAYHKELAYNYAQKFVESEDKNDLDLALKEAKKAYNLNPKNSLTLRSLIRFYYLISKISTKGGSASGGKPEYKTDLENLTLEIIKLSPREPRSYYDAALMFYYSDKNEKAKEFLSMALELKPDYTDALELAQKLSAPAVGKK